ncbi:MAG: ThuA domain-containing protein [Tepidisphaera sp.]
MRIALLILCFLCTLPLTACSSAPKPHVVFIAAEDEYRSEVTLASLAKDAQARGWATTLLTSAPDQSNPSNIPGLEALDRADLIVIYLRFRTLPAEQVAHLDRYLKRGGPIVGLRTSTHAFAYPQGHPLEEWNGFGERVLGAPWIRHFGHDSTTDVTHAPGAANDPLLKGVEPAFHVRSWLYDLEGRFPPPGARILLMGQSCDAQSRQVPSRRPSPVAWTRETPWNGRVFMTTLGHPEDFESPSFRALLRNGMDWALRENVR